MNLNVLLACHNRKQLTLNCLDRLMVAAVAASARTKIVVFDDGSTDGTDEAIQRLYPAVKIVKGSGSAFWAAGMATAEAEILNMETLDDSEYLLWLNDDVCLDPDALIRLNDSAMLHPNSIIIGAMRDPGSGLITYSGLAREKWHPLSFKRVLPQSVSSVAVETFNGNLVLVPARVARKLGGIDGSFAHAFADIDYGLRARRAGISISLAPGTFGTCPTNPLPERAGMFAEWRKFVGIKGGGNPSSLVRILRRNAPLTWPLFLASTYALWWLRQVRYRIIR